MQLLWLFAVVVAMVTTTQGIFEGGSQSNAQSQVFFGTNPGQQSQSQSQAGQSQKGGSKGQQSQSQSGQSQKGGSSGSKGCSDKEEPWYCDEIKSGGNCNKMNYANKCRKTCGLCGGASGCEDDETAQYCGRVKARGKCDRWGFSKRCAKTCGVCGCKDKDAHKACTGVKNSGSCKNWQAAKNCRWSCDRCVSDCHDKKKAKFCSDVKSKGKCDRWNFAEKCRKTCDVCGLPGPGTGNETIPVRHHCEVSGDPHLWGFNGERGSVPFPCVYRVADLMVDASAKSGYASVKVLVEAASSKNTYEGRFYVAFARITVTLSTATKGGKAGPDKTAVFTTDDNSVDRFLKKESSSAWSITGDYGAEMQSAVDVGSDAVERLAFLYLWDGSPAITFRPVNRAEGTPQSKYPGLYIDVDDDVIQTKPSQFPHTLCSNTNDTQKLADHLKGTHFKQTNHILLHTVLSQAVAQTTPNCKAAIATYKACGNLKDAVPKCQPLLGKPAVDCLVPTKLSAFDAFTFCLQFVCGSGVQNTQAGVFLDNTMKSMTPACQQALAHIPRLTTPTG